MSNGGQSRPEQTSAKHGQHRIETLRDYTHSQIGRMALDSIDQPEMVLCQLPTRTEKHETVRRLVQWVRTVLNMARSKGLADCKNTVTGIADAVAICACVLCRPRIMQCDGRNCAAICAFDRAGTCSFWDVAGEVEFDAQL